MNGYTKLFSSILASTIWGESKETKIVWITMLAMCDRFGKVDASIPGLATIARLTVSETESAIHVLAGPDPYSRTKEHDGRRIVEVNGGWQILNYESYRKKMSSDERREYLKFKKRESRERQRKTVGVNTASTLVADSQQSQHIAESREQNAKEEGAQTTAPTPFLNKSREEIVMALERQWNAQCKLNGQLQNGEVADMFAHLLDLGITPETISNQIGKGAKRGREWPSQFSKRLTAESIVREETKEERHERYKANTIKLRNRAKEGKS